jgi:hypothetical protein
MENLIAKTWSAEIDAAGARSALLEAISALPPAPFLRYSLSTHFMTRVFWNHWQKNNRLALLDAAEKCIIPLNRAIDKRRIKRIIQERAD